MKDSKIIDEIKLLKARKGIAVLAHYYQRPEVQDLADYVGDSLALAREVLNIGTKKIMFAGVHFMAETAKVINPECTVLIPDIDAGCSLADSCSPQDFKAFVDAHPSHKVVSYINCSAEIKAMSDIVCTSSNAEQIIRAVDADQPIVFAPDKNLGRYLISKTGRDMKLWDGACVVHEAFSIDKLLALHQQHPEAEIVAHPEAEPHLLKVAHFIGSTTAIIRYITNSGAREFIVATEVGILNALSKQLKDKRIIPAPTSENNTCACSECGFMKMNTLEKIHACLTREFPVIEIEESLRLRALRPLLAMLEHSNN
jgi:quinolinate synthase